MIVLRRCPPPPESHTTSYREGSAFATEGEEREIGGAAFTHGQYERHIVGEQ